MNAYRRICAKIILALALGFSLFELYTVGFGILSPFAQRATMLTFASVLVFLTKPMLDWDKREDVAPPARAFAIGWDALLIGLALWWFFSCRGRWRCGCRHCGCWCGRCRCDEVRVEDDN